MDVDFWGVVNGTKVFLPHLIASGDGHVVNVSSIFGLFSVPGQAAYNSAKFAVRGFTEALRQEMALAGHPVKVTCVHPGGIKTAIARNMETVEGLDKEELAQTFDKKLASTSPQKAARIILEAVRKNKARVLVGPDATALDLIVRATGSGYQRLFSTVMSRMVPTRTSRRARGRLVAERVFGQEAVGHQAGFGTVGDLCAHLRQRGGVQHTCHLVDRQHLRFGQLVAAVQRNHVLGADQRRAIGQHQQLGGNVGRRGRRPRGVDLPRPQCGE